MTTPRVDRPAKFAPYTPPSYESVVIPDTVAELWPHPVSLAPAPVELAPPAMPAPVAPVQVPTELVPTPIEVPAPQPVAPTPTPTGLAPQREDPLPASAYVIRESRFDGLTVLCAAMYTTYAAIIVGILSIIGYVLYPVLAFIQLIVIGIINAGPVLGGAVLMGLGMLGVSKFVSASSATVRPARPSLLSRLVNTNKPAKMVTYDPVPHVVPTKPTTKMSRANSVAPRSVKVTKPAKSAAAPRVKVKAASPVKPKPAKSAVAALVKAVAVPRPKNKPDHFVKPARAPKSVPTSAPAQVPESEQKRKAGRTKLSSSDRSIKSTQKKKDTVQHKKTTEERPISHLVGRHGAACGISVSTPGKKSDPICETCATIAGSYITDEQGTVTHYPFGG